MLPSRPFRTVSLLAGCILTVVLSTGCANHKLEDEKASLQQQNNALRAERDRALAEARAANERAAAAAARMVATPTTAPSMPTGLEDVPGVTQGKTEAGEDQIEIEGDVLFDTGKATIKPAFRATLDKIASVMKSHYAGRKFRIEGHTDPRPVRASGWDDNWDLGAARARAVALYLISRGVPKPSLYIASFADNQLRSPTDYALDRRVDIVVVK